MKIVSFSKKTVLLSPPPSLLLLKVALANADSTFKLFASTISIPVLPQEKNAPKSVFRLISF